MQITTVFATLTNLQLYQARGVVQNIHKVGQKGNHQTTIVYS
ncbi:hypothetical protein [Pontibacter burrus]|nr:hypothetical protein [Pontibacter burrus]